jgi:cellulose synthase/poly-beta-1,6-N-acetylglucosamine synthase-like glycosyltransferase
MPDLLRSVLSAVYLLLVAGMAFFAFHKVKMLLITLRHRRGDMAGADGGAEAPGVETPAGDGAPRVCVQCPVYNEAAVVEGLLEAVAKLRWPAGRLEIQVLDDSTDETPARIAAWLVDHPEVAGRFRHVRRASRAGYKAGALAHGLTLSDAGFFAIFDADFRPAPDFLARLMPHFADDERLGLVQARWDFANRDASLLTRFQALFLDAHFVIEQRARHAAGLFFNFNGTAGVWRRAAIEQAGGWSADTVTEDLDLSYRAQLRGWRFLYRDDVPVLSELPENVTAFKSQQRRWTKGGIQVMRKQLAVILRTPGLPGRIKREAAWHLTVGFMHPLLIAFAALLVPYFVWLRGEGEGAELRSVVLIFTFWATVGAYLAGRRLSGGSWSGALGVFLAAPFILSFGLAMSVTNTWAVLEGLVQRGGEFVRTPKGGAQAAVGSLLGRLSSRGVFLALVAGEAAFGAVFAAGGLRFLVQEEPLTAVLLLAKAAGFLALAGLSLRDLLPSVAR